MGFVTSNLLAFILFVVPTTGTEESPVLFQRARIGNPSVAGNTGMSPPIALTYPQPAYTADALLAGVEGVVTVRAEFDIDGNFEALDVVNGLGFGLDEAALAALENWQFRPAYRNGRRVRAVANIDVEFRIPRRTWSTHAAGRAYTGFWSP